MKKKIMIYAYTKFNLGDDLFIKALCERYPNTDFYLYASRGYHRLFSSLNNLTIINNDSTVIRGMRYILRRLGASTAFNQPRIAKVCDGAVYIGGSLFIQNNKWKEQLKRNRQKKINNQQFFLLGSNFGPYKEKKFLNDHKKLFSEYADVCFRDNFSYELFKELPNVRMANDIIFQLDTSAIGKESQVRNVVISVILPSKKQKKTFDNIYFQKIKDIIIHLIDKGYSITLMSFCENEGDEIAITEITKLVPSNYLDKINNHYYKRDIDKALNVISESNFVIATRFHSMILGWIFDKPVYPIVYSQKMKYVINDIGFKGNYIELEELEDLDPKTVFESISKNKIDVNEQIEDAKRHFEKLDEFLYL